jgi:hypothetical protein
MGYFCSSTVALFVETWHCLTPHAILHGTNFRDQCLSDVLASIDSLLRPWAFNLGV